MPPEILPEDNPPIGAPELDALLTAQILVAWAGETAGEPRRLGWWRSDLVSEYGGRDLFRRLMPKTWEWAVLQAIREAARRVDSAARSRHHAPDSIRSLYHWGFELDERLENRLLELKASETTPSEALPGLALVAETWDPLTFEAWLAAHGAARTKTEPIGRRILEPQAETPGDRCSALVAALLPLADTYPLPYSVSGR